MRANQNLTPPFKRTNQILPTYQPDANAIGELTKWPLLRRAHLEGIAANLDDIVEQGTCGSKWKCTREQCHIAKLNQHLQLVFQRVLVLLDVTFHFQINTMSIFYLC